MFISFKTYRKRSFTKAYNYLNQSYIALFSNVPVGVVEGEGVGVADLGVLEPLDVTLDGEELSVGSRIEREQTVSTILYGHMRSTASAQPPQYVELAAQLFTPAAALSHPWDRPSC